jgi:hypothetical protein
MAQPERQTYAPLRRVRANDWSAMGGPVLPGEFRPAAPTPAASDSGNGPSLPEKELLRQLILHYRWVWVGVGQLKRYNPQGRDLTYLAGDSDEA